MERSEPDAPAHGISLAVIRPNLSGEAMGDWMGLVPEWPCGESRRQADLHERWSYNRRRRGKCASCRSALPPVLFDWEECVPEETELAVPPGAFVCLLCHTVNCFSCAACRSSACERECRTLDPTTGAGGCPCDCKQCSSLALSPDIAGYRAPCPLASCCLNCRIKCSECASPLAFGECKASWATGKRPVLVCEPCGLVRCEECAPGEGAGEPAAPCCMCGRALTHEAAATLLRVDWCPNNTRTLHTEATLVTRELWRPRIMDLLSQNTGRSLSAPAWQRPITDFFDPISDRHAPKRKRAEAAPASRSSSPETKKKKARKPRVQNAFAIMKAAARSPLVWTEQEEGSDLRIEPTHPQEFRRENLFSLMFPADDFGLRARRRNADERGGKDPASPAAMRGGAGSRRIKLLEVPSLSVLAEEALRSSWEKTARRVKNKADSKERQLTYWLDEALHDAACECAQEIECGGEYKRVLVAREELHAAARLL